MNLSHLAAVPKVLPETVRLPREYLTRRGTVLDCGGPLVISAKSHWGYGVLVLTRSHDISQGSLGAVVPRGVRVDDGAWICSRAVLSGCHIGAGAIVAAGTVVRGQDVAPAVMVAGNPARVIARWDGERWAYVASEVSGFNRRLA